MKKIVLASNNKHKIKEFKEILENVEIITLNDIGYEEEIEEIGDTFLDNALIKAKTISEYLKKNNLNYDVISDDSGLCCFGLDLEPGVYSARYAGEHVTVKENRDKLIANLNGKNNEAYFICTIVLYHIDDTYEYATGKTYGKIINKEIGDTSFGYDCIFLSDELNKTFGEATSDEKNKVSHRYKALKEIKRIIEGGNKNE